MGDFTLIVIPCLLTLTYTWLAIGLSLIYILLAFVQTRGLPKQPTHKKTLTVDYTREISLDTPRALIHILTAIGILAVDFHIMPRYFIKCETYGQSMMDLGVAGFVFSSGIVAGPRLSNPASFVKTAKLIVPTALLGFGRAFVLKALNYQEHVTEYGVHWNFFMTLSSMPILASLQSLLIPFVPYWILALLIMLRTLFLI
jgi:phosphatidylinositol glycan class W